MQLALLTLFCSSLFFVSVVVAANVNFLEDKSKIEDLTAAYNFLTDDKRFSDLGNVLTPDVTFDPGTGFVKGIPATIDALLVIIPNTTISYFTLGTQLITFLPPFDKYGRANLAESVSYSTFVGYGTGDLTGQYFILDARFVDKEIVRTKQSGFGGWRFRNRKFEVIVSFFLFFIFLSPPSTLMLIELHSSFLPHIYHLYCYSKERESIMGGTNSNLDFCSQSAAAGNTYRKPRRCRCIEGSLCSNPIKVFFFFAM